MKKVKLFLTCLLAVLTMALYAQNRQISGTVTDPDGNPMPGVAVFVEGTNVGTVTDANGAYTLNMRGGNVVKFSFFGMRDVIVPVDNQGKVDVRMEEDTIGLDEVVITATGMTRQEKTLGYASTTVRSEEILKGHAADALSGLSGKVAGVQISSSGGTGTSQKVIVRGYSSFSSNAPLYVIDGVPVSNSTMGTQDLNNSIDFGNQAADINPEDIESITVLKGASATALYGSRAGNGAIIITTKRGDQNEAVKVTYDGSFQVSSVLRIPNIQNRFGQGWFYSYNGYNFENYSPTENGSWGNLLDGRDVIWRPGAAEQGYNPGGYDDVYDNPEYHTSYSYKKNSLRNFYTTGFEANNTVTIQGGSKNTGFVASYGNIYSDGILPGKNDYYKRNNFSFRGNTKIKEGLAWLNYSINYIRKDVRNAMTGQGGSGSTIYQDILQYPVNVDYADVRDWQNVLNNADNFYTPYAQNPWWTLDNNYSTYTDDRVYGSAEFGLQLAKGLQFIARGGADVTNFIQKEFDNIWTFSPGSYAESEGASVENGKYEEYVRRNSQIDANFLLNADYRLGQDFSIHGVAGVNVNQRNTGYTLGTLEGIAVSGWASFENTSGATPKASSYMTSRRLIGAYAQADFGWRDAIYLTLSARNDWSSTLPIDKNSYFYWGANASVILTDLFDIKSDVLSFLKIRGGYGQTGNDAPVYYTSSYYSLASATAAFGSLTFPLNSFVGLNKSTRVPSTDLKPEISTEAEFGIDARFFQNRLNFDLAFYNKLTENQIVSATLAPESGYTSAVRNVGKIRNKGIELAVGIVPIRTKDMEWNIGYTFSKNTNKVEELWDDVKEYAIYGLSSGPQLKAIVGEAVGTWVDYKINTVEDKNSPYYGYTIVNSQTGLPTYDNTQYETLGKADADFTMGLNTNFRYKDFTFGASFDYRKGGLMYSATKGIVLFDGNAEETMYNLRDPWVHQHAVYQSGKDASGNPIYTENNLPVNSYYNMNGEWYSNYNYVRYRDNLLDKTYLKLREITASYRLPAKWFATVNWLSTIELGVFGRNLLMWTPKQGLIDPDMTNYGNDLTSLYGEYYSAPSTRNIGCNIKIVF